MIFGCVGLHTQPFDRLVIALDDVAKRISEPVFIQVGYTTYNPKSAKCVRFLTPVEFDEKIRRARVVVTHDGAGSILSALAYGKEIVVIPRLKRCGECFYDNKAELAKKLQTLGLLKLVWDESQLHEAILTGNAMQSSTHTMRRALIGRIESYLVELEKEIAGAQRDL